MKSKRNTLARRIVFHLGIVFLFIAPGRSLLAQQLPISDIYIARPSWFNPASVGTKDLSRFFLSHQQRKLQWDGWRSFSNFLNYSSGPAGRHRNFGWGVMVNNDVEHTEQRIGVSFAVAAQLIKTPIQNLSVGLNVGMLNWSSNYRSNRVYTINDVLLQNPTSFAELDAGLGVRYSYTNYFLRSEVNAAVSQLPGNLVSKRAISAITLYPHLLIGGHALYTPDNNFFIGPLFMYRNTAFSQPATIKKGAVDVGIRADIDYWGLWLSAAYRINNSAVTGGFGLKILNPDTLFEQRRGAVFLDLIGMASYPLNESSVFGPSFEVGLILALGRAGENTRAVDTLKEVRGSFWKNDGNVNNHMSNKLKRTAPSGLVAGTLVTDKTVTLDYKWDDNMYMYSGQTPNPIEDTLLLSVGKEWVGVDGILGNLVGEVIREALHPDTANVEFPDSLEPLKDLISLEMIANLKVDALEADFGAQGAIFKGNLPEYQGADTLSIKVRYLDRDTIVTVYKDQNLSNLQLACLKLHSMRKKLEYELNKYFGTEMAFVWEGKKMSDEQVNGRKVVYIKLPVIVPDNPNQKPFQQTELILNFTRFPDFFANRAASEGRKGGKQSTKEARERKKHKNRYRDLVR